MANLLEVLVTCDSNNTLWTCCVWDPHTGTSLMTYKGGGNAESKTVSFIGKDYLAAVERTKPVLHIWPLNSHQTVTGMRFILPGKATALSISPDGCYCVAGIDEKIYLWQIASGNLITIINGHYQKVVMVKFTQDGKYFVSAAEDGMVMVWAMTTVAVNSELELVTQKTAGQHDPIYIFTDHSLPVMDLCISKTGMHGRLCTVSSDRTCKLYDLSTGELLVNLVFDVPLSAVCMDVLELNLFIGTTEGKVYEISLMNPPRSRDILVDTDENCPSFICHTNTITCLSVSLDGETLMSGSKDEQVVLWHIKSKQPVRVIRHKGPITNAFFTINRPAIYKQDFSPSIVLHSLDRTLEKYADDITEIEVLVNKKIDFWPKPQGEIGFQQPEYVSPRPIENNLKAEDGMLREELNKLKKINANLYAMSITKVLNNSVAKSTTINNKRKKTS